VERLISHHGACVSAPKAFAASTFVFCFVRSLLKKRSAEELRDVLAKMDDSRLFTILTIINVESLAQE
jgi:FPC/CPF motif-containing protein YcgG